MRPIDNLCVRLPKLSIAPEPSRDIGSHPAQQADPAGEVTVIQSVPAATDRRMNRASVTSCCSTSDQAGSAGSNNLAEEGPTYLNSLVRDSKGESKELATQPLTIAPKVDIRGKQSVLRVGLLNKLTRKLKICGVCTQGSRAAVQADSAGKAIDVQSVPAATGSEMNRASVTSCCSTSDQDGSLAHDFKGECKELAIQPLTMAPNVDIQGKQSDLKFSIAPHTNAGARVVLSNNGKNRLNTEISDTLNMKDPVENNRPKDDYPEKLMSSLKRKIAMIDDANREVVAAVGPASTTAIRGVNISSTDGSNATEAPQGDGRVVAAADASDAKTITSNLQSLSLKDEDSLLASSTYPATVTNQGFENHSVPEKDEAILVSPSPVTPTECAAKVDSESTSLKKKKSVILPSRQEPIDYIRAKGPSLDSLLSTSPPLVSLGERCPLCGIDLAFAARGDSRSGDPPFAAVLPCRHTYHDSCLRNLFGDVEPPCIQCLGI